MRKQDKFSEIKVISINGIIGALKIYFREVWQREIETEDVVKALELNKFTEKDLEYFSFLFRDIFFKAFEFNFPELMYSLFWSTFLLDSFSDEKKIFNRLEKIFWTTASDKDLEEYLIFWDKKKGSSSFQQELDEFKRQREKNLSRTRKESIVPSIKNRPDDDLVLQYFLTSLDFSDQEIN
jgi:hypothetical protein